MTKPSLKEVQDLMMRLWSNSNDLETFKSTGELPGVPKEFLEGLDPERVAVYHQDIVARRMRFTKGPYALTLRVIGNDKGKIVNQYWDEYASSHFDPFEGRDTFPAFLRTQNELMEKYPYLADLAEYEWIRFSVIGSGAELEVGQPLDLESVESYKQYYPVVNSTILLKKFDYPADKVAKRVAGGRWRHYKYKVKDFYLVVYQDPEDREEIRVQELGEVAYKLLESAQKQKSFEQLVQEAIELIPEQTAQETTADVIYMFQQFARVGIFMGQKGVFTPGQSSQVPHSNAIA